MLPIIIDVKARPVLLVGEGDLAERRLALLDAASANVRVFSLNPSHALLAQAGERLIGQRPSEEEIAGSALVFGAGLMLDVAEELAVTARRLGVLVNIEDVKRLCDFHVPAMVRRGDLTVTVSTGGKSPGLAKRLCQHIGQKFGPEWAGRLDKVAERRDKWRTEGASLSDISRKTDEFIDRQGWLS